MISASKYQHIICFMSLLKVSLCINRPKQRLLCMDTRNGCRSKRSPTPWKNKNIFFHCLGGLFATFFSMGDFLCCVSFLMRGFFHCIEAFLLLFLCMGLLLRLSPGVGLFSQSGGFLATFFSMWGDSFVFMGDFMFSCFFYGLAPLPYDFFAGACYYVTLIPCPPV